MKYTEDEASFISGVLTSYLFYPGVQPAVQAKYSMVCQHLNTGRLSEEDIHNIKNAFDFLLPKIHVQPEEQNLMWSAYLTTKSMLR